MLVVAWHSPKFGDLIHGVVNRYGNAILLLGTRKAESQVREGRINQQVAHRLDGTDLRGQLLRPNANLPNSLVYTPIEDWTNDDVWLYLMQVKNPWGHDNKTLLTMYRGATEGGECPLVVDTSTPSCGGSRFGCWVCTVVDKDRSMEAMIENDAEKLWMTPLLDLRNELDQPDRDRRDFRRLTGRVQLFHDRTIPGPYTKQWRQHWLRRVLEAQQSARAEGPPEFRNLTLITPAELQEIRRIWVYEKGKFDDSLPRIYQETTGEPFPTPADHDNPLRADDWALLREVCPRRPRTGRRKMGRQGVTHVRDGPRTRTASKDSAARRRSSTPKALHSPAQGRGAHPGLPARPAPLPRRGCTGASPVQPLRGRLRNGACDPRVRCATLG